MPEIEFIPCTLMAERQPDEVGWLMREHAGEPELVMARVRDKSGSGTHVRVVHHTKRPIAVIGSQVVSQALGRGWVFDPSIKRWRAPEEPLVVLPPLPQQQKGFRLAVEYIRYGWMSIGLADGAQRITLTADDLTNEIIDLVKWVADISTGRASRCAFVAGETDHILHGIPFDGDGCRLVVTDIAGTFLWDAAFTIDIVVDGFSAFLKELADHPCLGVHWCCHARLSREQSEIKSRNRERIDTALDARFGKDSLSEDAWATRNQLEAEMLAAAVPLTDEQQQFIRKYQAMLRSLVVPDGWRSMVF